MLFIKRFFSSFHILGIVFFIACDHHKEKVEAITFSDQVAPIIFKHCTSCHRPGEAAPFSLLTYNDALVRKDVIKFVSQSRFMPPWPADASYRHFVDENVMSDQEIKLISEWVDQGCKPGDSTHLPPLPFFPAGSQLGKPDLVLQLRDVYKIKGNNKALVPGTTTLCAELWHTVEQEMAIHLEDVVMRRTDLAAGSHPGRAVLHTCAALMGERLAWSTQRT
ncbi:MAG TPA: glycerol-3-phosphate dehydrogenase C-terminal domain-containing protein, partial [Bacteroidia bacterium]|nr:glycerol-3-phosphate dehydrogenase C-terminal domain-containing protein [Bacteroidia bacterium]